MREIKACGMLIVRGNPVHSFLLMQHRHRWDLPKGHLEDAETELECAWRELGEETGIQPADVELLPGFRFVTTYVVNSRRFGEECRKTVVIFLGRLHREVAIAPTEHPGFQWISWQPPHKIQAQTIDPLLAEVERFLTTSP